MTKAELRTQYLLRQRSVAAAERERCSQLITDVFFTSALPHEAQLIHCFIPIEKFNEIDTRPIFARLWENYTEVATVVPRVDFAAGMIESVSYGRKQELSRNRWGIEEPCHAEGVPATEVDVVVVPLLAYDRAGYRVGYGKGFYDRFLAKCRRDCLKVGLSYFPPVERIEDTHEYDIPLNLCITPEQVYIFDGV